MSIYYTDDFNLEHTLNCGQLFRFVKRDEWYYIVSRNRMFRIRQLKEGLEYEGVDKEFLVEFFSLDEPYSHILKQISKDDIICTAVKEYYGMRIIRHDPWECTLSFLCSSAANIPKIRLNLEMLSQYFGSKIKLNGFEWYSFPGMGELNNYEKIALSKTGFRAKYIKAVNDIINEEFLNSLKGMPYKEAKTTLKRLPGIGNKIADCILLFSCGFSEAFPVDTWIKRILRQYYFEDRKVSNEQLYSFGMDYFGKYAGYAQQFLYIYAKREKGE